MTVFILALKSNSPVAYYTFFVKDLYLTPVPAPPS